MSANKFGFAASTIGRPIACSICVWIAAIAIAAQSVFGGEPIADAEFRHAKITDAWEKYRETLTFGREQTLALIDDGCDLSRAEWKAVIDGRPKVLVAHDAVDGDDNPKHEGRGYHGTTIGIPSSVNLNGKWGVAYNNQLAVIRGLECCHCKVADSKSLAAALRWVSENHEKYRITTVNLAPVDDQEHGSPVATEIDELLAKLRRQNIWVSAPAGNHNFRAGISWPACQADCFAIGAVKPGKDDIYLDRSDKIALLVPARATSSSNAIACGAAMLLREAIQKSGFDWKRAGHSNLPDALMSIFQRTGTKVTDPATGKSYARIDVLAALNHVFETTAQPSAVNAAPRAQPRPNIVWIISEDMSPHFGCYGEKSIATPNVDRLAAEGTRFSRAHVTAPICSTSRSALITGMYQTAIGCQHHRSGRGTVKIALPPDVVPITKLFRDAGYWTTNGAWPAKGKGKEKAIGKTDYNFQAKDLYDGADWGGRAPHQPFFAQVQLHGGKVRDGANAAKVFQETLGSLTPGKNLPLPPYYPRTDAILDDWALTLDACRLVDQQVGEIRARLESEGLLDNTAIFFITDHGVSHARGKQYLYAEGTHIPFVVRGPGIAAGKVRNDLIQHIDMAATSLAMAGITPPAWMQARDLFAAKYQPRDAVFSARDRADETVDHIRSARDERWLYIRNYHPQRPHLQPNNYKDNKRCYVALRDARAQGKLDALQESLFAPTRAAEELYDTQADPWEINNVAADPAHAQTLARLRARLDRWMEETNDLGRKPETAAQFESDMAAYLGEAAKGPRAAEIQRNIDQMKRWAAEGK